MRTWAKQNGAFAPSRRNLDGEEFGRGPVERSDIPEREQGRDELEDVCRAAPGGDLAVQRAVRIMRRARGRRAPHRLRVWPFLLPSGWCHCVRQVLSGS